jgi:site-specific DNA-cytosine methylase
VRPRLLDLFCGAGGASVGYHRAGFDVVGVDNQVQPHYPFEFHQADAMTYPLDGFDAIHASPPCQAFTVAKSINGRQHIDLLTPTRERLRGWGGVWVIENVPGAPMRPDWRRAMGIDWMNRDELAQAVPPAYTEYIGYQLLAALELAS